MYNPEVELVTVFCTGDRAAIAVAKSILEGANIPYYAKNEMLMGRSGMFPGFGGIALQVSSLNAEDARQLLQDLVVEDGSELTSPSLGHDLAVILLIIGGTITLISILRMFK